MELSIDWGMRRGEGGSTLRVEYAVTNRSSERLYLCDILVTTRNNRLVRADDRMIVLNGERMGLVKFTRGVVNEPVTSSFPRNPGARAFDPGTTLLGWADVPLPLEAWHNYGTVRPLRGTPKSAVLELSYVKGDVTWAEERLSDGTRVTVPQRTATLQSVLSDEQVLPPDMGGTARTRRAPK